MGMTDVWITKKLKNRRIFFIFLIFMSKFVKTLNLQVSQLLIDCAKFLNVRQINDTFDDSFIQILIGTHVKADCQL